MRLVRTRPAARVGTRTGRARATVLGAAPALLLLLGGCAWMEPPQVAEAGVDTLTSPLPDLGSRAWVEGLTHPDLAVPAAGTTFDDGSVLRLAEGTTDVDGVAASALVRTDADGATSTTYLAQDASGNVWWLGQDDSEDAAADWRAGEDGAEAGLLLPAEPRRGDGWATAGEAVPDAGVATVVSLDGQVVLADGAYSGALVVRTVSDGASTTSYYLPGTGLVAYTAGSDVVGAVDPTGSGLSG
ncbi:hypothetical protein [Nocardioides bruguierae]|uniref:Uncharacterized protein n=1 Tax=Nocardioides bruguierae TaxID=2945102 RepID=A0A9X2IEW5_9ACTN|nr:hypothetical protein [Nocardioides bruguierae]MCL8025194.1 hypothetical protein [Nocardioides bruguierae]MCM0621246.1 hypothetical protein [Nocardioides bruguierae]